MPTGELLGAVQVPEESAFDEYRRILGRRRRQILVVVAVVVFLSGLRSIFVRPVYEGVARLLIERENPNVLTFKEVAQVDSARDDYYQTQYKLLQSRSLARLVIAETNLLQDVDFGGPRPQGEVDAMLAAVPGQSRAFEGVVDGVLSQLRVQPDKNSRLVSVVYESSRPDQAAHVANRFAAIYIDQTLALRSQTSTEAGQWLGNQIREQRASVESAELALQKLKEEEGIVSIEERKALIEQRLRELGTAVTSAKAARLGKAALFGEMRAARLPEELPEVIRSPVVQGLRIELAALERKGAQLAQKYLDQHPEVLQVNRQMVETRQRIADEAQRVIRAAENDHKAAIAQEANLEAALEASKAEALDLSRRSRQYDSLMRELEAAKAVLGSLLSRSKETDVTRELKTSNIRIVDPAIVPAKPVRPNLKKDLVLGLLLGMGLGIGLAFFIEHLDSTVKTPDDVRGFLGVPLLAVIPERTGEELVLLHAAGHGVFAEGYRTLRTALSYSWPEEGSRVILLTSAGPGEGKTLTSVNLGLTLASLTARVLLIDCDMRRPHAHACLGGYRSPGLSDVLVGKADFDKAIQRPEVAPLHLLAAGTAVPSPADLLTVGAVRRVIEELRLRYDWIVLDTPPANAVADPLILAPLVDGVVIVTGAEMLPRAAVRGVLHRVAETGVRILGVVLNRARVDRYSYYYSAYYGNYYGEHEAALETTQPSSRTAALK